MAQYDFAPDYDPGFVGREAELNWLDARLLDRTHRWSSRGVFVVGPGGVGKTALARHWLSSRRHGSHPLWVDLHSQPNPSAAIDEFTAYLYEQRRKGEFIVVLDGSDALSDREHQEAIGKVFNFKAVRSLVFTTRRSPSVDRADTLTLGPVSESEATELLKALSSRELTLEAINEAVDAANGYPLAIQLLAGFLKSGDVTALRHLLQGPLYDLSQTIAVPYTEIVAAVAPTIITAKGTLVAALQKCPADIHSLTPRKFEELLAELLSGMGWDVELTQQTRDGGKDILAYLNTDLGRILCLVEAKHFRTDRKVGVDLVRNLYGTFCDAQANSAMLVTSSAFTADAREFQQKHSYQLALRDYADLVKWIMKYKSGAKTV